jgi:hypothetical protein
MSDELIVQINEAVSAKDWARVTEIATRLLSSPKTLGAKKKRTVAPSDQKKEVVSSNRFVDDKTLEKQHIQTDKKWLKHAQPTSRRPASSRDPVQAFCPKCNKSHMVAPAIAALRQGLDAGIVCPSCLRGSRR